MNNFDKRNRKKEKKGCANFSKFPITVGPIWKKYLLNWSSMKKMVTMYTIFRKTLLLHFSNHMQGSYKLCARKYPECIINNDGSTLGKRRCTIFIFRCNFILMMEVYRRIIQKIVVFRVTSFKIIYLITRPDLIQEIPRRR